MAGETKAFVDHGEFITTTDKYSILSVFDASAPFDAEPIALGALSVRKTSRGDPINYRTIIHRVAYARARFLDDDQLAQWVQRTRDPAVVYDRVLNYDASSAEEQNNDWCDEYEIDAIFWAMHFKYCQDHENCAKVLKPLMKHVYAAYEEEKLPTNEKTNKLNWVSVPSELVVSMKEPEGSVCERFNNNIYKAWKNFAAKEQVCLYQIMSKKGW